MRQIITSTLFCFSICVCFAQTQSELNDKANQDYKKANKELNSIYQRILKEYVSDTVFISNFKKTQRIWIQLRDAEMKARYPDREPGYYGSVQPMCWSIYLTELTRERIDKLETWIRGIDENDVCAGAVKTKE